MTSAGRPGHGLIGYGIVMYKPNCAYSCQASLTSTVLSCSEVMPPDMEGMEMSMDDGPMTSPECYASDDAFLQTLAYCMSIKCVGANEAPTWQLEKWWSENVAGRASEQPLPKETYAEALGKINIAPTKVVAAGDSLNETSLVNEDDYVANFNAQEAFEDGEVLHEKFG
jgi:hypothetical protein